jgi:release factor glutamine methyltransferase
MRSDFSHVDGSVDVYPPSMPDTLLFLALLARESAFIADLCPAVCIEVGCGAAPLAACLAQLLGPSSTTLATDLSVSAVRAAAETSRRNGLTLHLACMDLVSALRPGMVDVMVFHPPYVPTTSALLDEAAEAAAAPATSMERAAFVWAGGPSGRAVLDRQLESLPTVLSERGVAYVLFFEEAAFEGLERLGLHCSCVARHQDKSESFVIMRIERACVQRQRSR